MSDEPTEEDTLTALDGDEDLPAETLGDPVETVDGEIANEGFDEALAASAPQTTLVPTDLNPDTWPSTTEGTVTDPDVLRRHGLGPDATPEPEPLLEVPTPTSASGLSPEPGPVVPVEVPASDEQAWQCWREDRASANCPVFRSNAHRGNPPTQPTCPTCGSAKLLAVMVPPNL